MQSPIPFTRDLVLLGGGHTHALLMRKWGMNPLAGARLTLVNPGPFAAYSGMLPGHIAGHYTREALDIDLIRLARFANARWINGAATAVDPGNRTVTVLGRPPLRFDVLSIDIGVSSEMPKLPGFGQNAEPVKPLGPFAAKWEAFVESVDKGLLQPRAVVIGAGVAGAELAMAMMHRLKQRSAGQAMVTLVEARTALAALPDRTATRLRAALRQTGVVLREHTAIARVHALGVELADGEIIDYAFCAGAAGANPQGWLQQTGLPLHDGYLRVDSHLRVRGPIFAVGDCAHMDETPRPKAGVFAVRQAPVLYHNLRAELSGGTLRSYKPQADYLKLISLGEKSALADRGGLAVTGRSLWTLKDRIDRGFMRKFDALPQMTARDVPSQAAIGVREALGDGAPLCGGCGSKVGPAGLRAGLREVPAPQREDVLSQPGDDAAVLQIGDTRQVITTDHLRAVTEDAYQMARIAAVHALGDIWAMGADPQAALSTLILPRMSQELQRATLSEISAGAAEVLAEAGADLVGGHTTQGSELTIGFTITGLAHAEPILVNGARPGDALILTRPLGSGTLLAAEMQSKARGDWIVSLLAQMVRPQGDVASILAPHANAMTDVTGFGLAGHLLIMAEAAKVSVVLDLDAVPFYHGARELAAAGVRSTLYADNSDFARPSMMGFPEDTRTDLLLDPQTCGGLLAAIPAEHAPAVIAALQDLGCTAAQIGSVETGPAVIING